MDRIKWPKFYGPYYMGFIWDKIWVIKLTVFESFLYWDVRFFSMNRNEVPSFGVFILYVSTKSQIDPIKCAIFQMRR